MSLFSEVGSRLREPKQLVMSVLGLSISAGCIYWMLQSIEFSQVKEHLMRADIKLLLVVFMLTQLSYVLRAWRWSFFFPEDQKFSFAKRYQALIMGFFFNNALPARIGELVRARVGKSLSGSSGTYVLATIVGERLMDGMSIAILFVGLFSFAEASVADGKGVYLYLVAGLFFVASSMCWLLVRKRAFFFGWLSKFAEGRKRIFKVIIKRVERFLDGLGFMFEPRVFGLLWLSSLVVWGTELMVYYTVSEAFGAGFSLAEASLFMAVVNFSGLVPAAPGAIGVIEAFSVIALGQIGVDSSLALSMTVSQHLIQIVAVAIPGILVGFKLVFGAGAKNLNSSDSLQE